MFDLGIQVLLNCYSKQLNVNTEDTLFSSLSQNKEVLFFYFPLQQLKISCLQQLNIRCLLYLTTKSWVCNSSILILLFCFDQVVTQTRTMILAFHCNQGGGGGSKNRFIKRKHFLHNDKCIIRACQISVNFTFPKF